MKHAYLDATWEKEYIEMGMQRLKEQVSLNIVSHSSYLIISFSSLSIKPSMKPHRKIQQLQVITINNVRVTYW